MSKQRGTVKWFSREKGWGFIRRENGDEIFVHHSDIEGDGFVNLVDDEPVEFTVEEMEKGPRARNVRSLDGGASAGDASPAGRPVETAAEAEAASDRAEAAPSDRQAADPKDRDRSRTGLRPLAEQIVERLGARFPGFRD